MNFLLKIVEGPNKGAEIALVEGVAVSLGKRDDCDIVLADATLPEEPLKISATSDKVTLDGEDFAPFHVKTAGATSFAVGPADSPWESLVWPKAAHEETPEDASGESVAEEAPVRTEPEPSSEPAAGKRHGGCLGCLLAALLVLLLLLGLCWFFRDAVKPVAESLWGRVSSMASDSRTRTPDSGSGGAENGGCAPRSLADIAARYGLALDDSNGRATLSGNLATRRERLAATAEAYAVRPGVDIDLSDDESFRTSAEDALFTLTEGALKILCATNRVLVIAGSSQSPADLKNTLDALNADLPKLKSVDVEGVRYSAGAKAVKAADDSAGESVVEKAKRARRAQLFPVCGILTAPYPCLVMKNGARVLEGAAIGDSVILKIEADSVTLTNATGRFTWRP